MIYLYGFTCCLGAASFYCLSRITNREVEILKSVTRVCHLKDLAELLQVDTRKVCPLIVSVSGSVGSETPIKSEHSGLLGVIFEETVEQHFLKRNWKFSWVQDSAWMKPVTKQVPWYLDDETGCVNVTGARGALGFTFTDSSEVFEKAEPSSLVRGTLNFLQGLKMLGVRRIEHVLPVGTQLTIVGEAVKDSMGDVRIQEPKKGPFFVSRLPLDELISESDKWPRRFKNASMGLFVVGVILISKPVIEYILVRIGHTLERRRERRLVLRRARDAAEEAARRIEQATIELERRHVNSSSDGRDRDDQVNDQCVICLDKKYDTAFVQCGHMCCCMTCSSRLQGNNCPICRLPIDHVLKIYRS